MTLPALLSVAASQRPGHRIVVVDLGPPSFAQLMISTAIMMIIGTLIAVGIALLLKRFWRTGPLAAKSLIAGLSPIAVFTGLGALVLSAAENSNASYGLELRGYAACAATFAFAFLVSRRVLVWRSDAR
jgi:hypothetical protein